MLSEGLLTFLYAQLSGGDLFLPGAGSFSISRLLLLLLLE